MKTTDLSYSFLSDAEPTEAQLEAIMREVAEEAVQKRKRADVELKKMIHREIKDAAQRGKRLFEQNTQNET